METSRKEGHVKEGLSGRVNEPIVYGEESNLRSSLGPEGQYSSVSSEKKETYRK